MENLLETRSLFIHYRMRQGTVRAVENVISPWLRARPSASSANRDVANPPWPRGFWKCCPGTPKSEARSYLKDETWRRFLEPNSGRSAARKLDSSSRIQ